MTRHALYAALGLVLLSHTVFNKTLTQITLIDDDKRSTEHVMSPSDQSAHSNHVIELNNSTQFNNGTHNNGNLTMLCIRCSPGQYSTANCTNKALIKSAARLEGSCASGYCMMPLNCSLCPLGTYNDQFNASACLACRAGTYADRAGSLNCTECRAGSYEARNGSARCQSCGQGYYNPDRGATSRTACRACEAGTYCPDLETREPVQCQARWYCPSTALPGPVPCPAGRYCPRQQMTEPQSCPMGFYCPHEGMLEPTPCPMNHYCLTDTVTPEPCSFLFASATQQTECSPTVLFYLVLVVGGLFAVLFVLWIVIRAVRRVRASAETKRRTEYTKLIPEPIDGPRYSGL